MTRVPSSVTVRVYGGRDREVNMACMDPDKAAAVQAVVDRVGSYQDGAPEGTVEKELRSGLGEAGVELDDADVATLTEAIEHQDGEVEVASLLG